MKRTEPAWPSALFRLTSAAGLALLLSSAAHAGELDSSGACSGDGSYADAVMSFESGAAGQFSTNPSSTATGSFQFVFRTLQDLGYIAPGQSTPPPGSGSWSGVVWTGQDGIYSRDQFMSSMDAQTRALERFSSTNLGVISGSFTPGQTVNGVTMTNGGAALAAHMLGSGGFQQWAASGFQPSGLSAANAAAHGMTLEEYNNHMMERVAAGGCYDPGNIATPDGGGDGTPVQDLPVVFLMPWEVGYKIPAVLPGGLASLGG